MQALGGKKNKATRVIKEEGYLQEIKAKINMK